MWQKEFAALFIIFTAGNVVAVEYSDLESVKAYKLQAYKVAEMYRFLTEALKTVRFYFWIDFHRSLMLRITAAKSGTRLTAVIRIATANSSI